MRLKNRFSIMACLCIFVMACSDAKEDHPLPPVQLESITNTIGTELVLIPAGHFVMGEATRSQCDTCNAEQDETPRHHVTITKPFYISRYEVTQKEWLMVMKENPSQFKGDERPVENVSWIDVKLFIEGLNRLEKIRKYRLPTEAEWEYAARAGSIYAYCFGDNYKALGKYAWYNENAGLETHPVGRLKPNAWGLYDMHGNVLEWVQDLYDSNYYAKSPARDPAGPGAGSIRVRRGGAFDSTWRRCRSSDRDGYSQHDRSRTTGFRLAMDR